VARERIKEKLFMLVVGGAEAPGVKTSRDRLPNAEQKEKVQKGTLNEGAEIKRKAVRLKNDLIGSGPSEELLVDQKNEGKKKRLEGLPEGYRFWGGPSIWSWT